MIVRAENGRSSNIYMRIPSFIKINFKELFTFTLVPIAHFLSICNFERIVRFDLEDRLLESRSYTFGGTQISGTSMLMADASNRNW